MFANFLYFIIVLLIYTTYQPPEETNFTPAETTTLFLLLVISFFLFCRLQFRSIEKRIDKADFSHLDHRFNAAVNRLSIVAILLFTVDIYGLNLPSFFNDMWLFDKIPTIQALMFLCLFIFYLAIVWGTAHQAYLRIYRAGLSRRSYILSNIFFAVPVLLPWLLLSRGTPRKIISSSIATGVM